MLQEKRDLVKYAVIDGNEITPEMRNMAHFNYNYVFLPKKKHIHKLLYVLSGFKENK